MRGQSHDIFDVEALAGATCLQILVVHCLWIIDWFGIPSNRDIIWGAIGIASILSTNFTEQGPDS